MPWTPWRRWVPRLTCHEVRSGPGRLNFVGENLLAPLGGHDKNKNKSRRKEEETKSAEDIK